MDMMTLIRDGGPIMYVIAICSIAAVYIFIEKWFQFHRAQTNVKELISGLENVLKRDGMIEAITLCDHTPGPVARILTAAIQAYQNGDDIKQAIDDKAQTEVPRLEAHLNILATIAYITPLLGLLGTVIGLLDAFRSMKQGTSTLDVFSSGMSIALICTAAGLSVAIPCHIAYNYLVSRVQAFCVEMERASSEIIYFFAQNKKTGKSSHDS